MNTEQELLDALQEAIDLLAERKYGNPARSPGHNARLLLQDILASRREEQTEVRTSDGWALVPREPTETMVDAARHFLEPSTERIGRAAWRAMLDASPPPPAVAAGGVTEAQIKRAVDAALGEPENARRAADPDHPEADYAAGRVDAAQCVRDALTSVLAVGDEGIREGWQPIETLKDREGRYLFWLDWSDDCAPLNPPLPANYPGRWHAGRYGSWTSVYKATHWHSPLPPQPLPPPPSRGEGV